MNRRLRVKTLVAWLGTAGLLALAAAVPAAAVSQHPGHAAVASHRGCTWTTGYNVNNGPPGTAAVWFNSISPSGCEQYRVNITSQNPPNLRYTSGWISRTGIQSSINTCADSSDCGRLLGAWEDRRPTGSSTHQCRPIYNAGPPGPWRDNCTAD
jgi:hypothetical protein